MFVTIFITLAIVVSMCLYTYVKNRRYWKHIMAIPGPRLVPFLGNIELVLQLTPDSLFKSDRARAQEYYPIYKLQILNESMVSLISPEDIELVLSNTKHNDKGSLYKFLYEWLGNGLLTSKGSLWQTRRKILTPAFHFTILQEFVDIFNKEAAHLVKEFENQCEESYIDVVKPITKFTLYSIGETSFGVSLKNDPYFKKYKEAIHEFNNSMIHRVITPWLHPDYLYAMSSISKKVKEQVSVLHAFSKRVIEDRKDLLKSYEQSYTSRKRLAMLDLLLKAKNDGIDIDDNGIREEVDTFMFEGHDTTAVAICYVLMTLANEEMYQEEIRKEIDDILGKSTDCPTFNQFTDMKFMERCIKECLRLYPSVPFIQRISGEEFKSNSGYIIPKNVSINMYIFDMHRNPTVWENPLTFDPDRFLPDNFEKRHPFAYLPFSAGSRNCIGQRFAILEIKAVVCAVLRKFRLEPVDKPEDMKFKSDMILRPAGEIRVKFVPL